MIPCGMEKYFNYLEDLRRSGVTNMFGASPYLESEFGIDRKQARDILGLWMRTYDRADYDEEV